MMILQYSDRQTDSVGFLESILKPNIQLYRSEDEGPSFWNLFKKIYSKLKIISSYFIICVGINENLSEITNLEIIVKISDHSLNENYLESNYFSLLDFKGSFLFFKLFFSY